MAVDIDLSSSTFTEEKYCGFLCAIKYKRLAVMKFIYRLILFEKTKFPINLLCIIKTLCL